MTKGVSLFVILALSLPVAAADRKIKASKLVSGCDASRSADTREEYCRHVVRVAERDDAAKDVELPEEVQAQIDASGKSFAHVEYRKVWNGREEKRIGTLHPRSAKSPVDEGERSRKK